MGMMASNVGGAYAESLTSDNSTDSSSAQSLTGNTTTGVSNTTVEGNKTNTESTSDESNDSSLNESSNESTATDSNSESENSTTSSDNSTKTNSNTNTTDNSTNTNDNSTNATTTADDNSTNTTTGTVTGNSTNSAVSCTLSEIEDAASRVAAFIEKNSRLPNYVTINSAQVSMQDFLYLAVNSVLNIERGSTSSVNSSTYTSPTSSAVSDLKSVKVYSSEYLKIAASIASFMESNGKAPSYASSSKGKISYASLVYMYAKILNFESTNNRLPNYATTTSIKYTVNNITTTIPTTTTSDNSTTNTTSDNTTISDNSTTNSDNTTTNSTTSDNSTNTTTGNSTVATDNSTNTTTNGTVTDDSTNSTLSFTLSEIEEAATGLVTYVKANSSLPDYVTINGTQVSMSNFLNLLVNSVLNIYNNSTSTVTLGNYSSAPNSAENVTAGKINESEYITMAESIASFMESNGRAPNYASSSLGNMGYESLIYMYSKILAFAETNSRLPNYNTVATWETVTNNTTTTSDNSTTSTDTSDDIPSEYEKYLAATTNCQSTNSKIIALANSIISDAGATTTYAKAVAIYNWVRDNITYSFYSGTKYGAVGTLNAGKGNCCDKTNLLIALLRAAGIPARYVHGYCYFTTSGHWYGHIWAEVYVNGTWYTADTTSSRNSFGTVKNWNTATATIYGRYTTIPC